MTEQEFRDELKRCIGSTGLSSDRQYQVLARMKGEERRVRTWNKMRISLVMAAVVMLTMGVAAATEVVKYINWKGEPVDYEPPTYVEWVDMGDPLRDPTAEMLISSKKLEEVLVIEYPTWMRCERHKTEVASLEELRQLAGEEALLPIPVNIPDGFTLEASVVILATKPGTVYRDLGMEKYKDVIRVRRYTCDRDDLLLVQYFLYFRDADGEHLNFSVRMIRDKEYFLQANAEKYGVLHVSGMEQAVYIDQEDRTIVYMQKSLPEPVDIQIVGTEYGELSLSDPGTDVRFVALELQANSTVFGVETMLECFGLTAE